MISYLALFEWLMEHPILGEWYALCISLSLKMCVHGYHHLVLILHDYLVTMWCVKLMRNSNSKWPLIISSRILMASCWKQMIITLWGSNMLFVYYNPRKCENMRLCHLELILLIILFLGGMLTRSPFIKKLILLIILVFVWVRNSWCGFPQIHISISYLGNRLLQVIQSLLCVIVWLVEAIKNLYVHSA